MAPSFKGGEKVRPLAVDAKRSRCKHVKTTFCVCRIYKKFYDHTKICILNDKRNFSNNTIIIRISKLSTSVLLLFICSYDTNKRYAISLCITVLFCSTIM